MSLSALQLPNFRYHINNRIDQRRLVIEDIPADTGTSCMFMIVVLVVKIVDCSMEWERLYESL